MLFIGEPVEKKEEMDESVDVARTVLLGLSAMAIFFSFGFFLAGAVAEPGLLIVAATLLAAGLIMLAWRWAILVRYRKRVKKEELEDMVKCEYCGGQNRRGENKCRFCGAPLW